jgi:hypothetical protein
MDELAFSNQQASVLLFQANLFNSHVQRNFHFGDLCQTAFSLIIRIISLGIKIEIYPKGRENENQKQVNQNL